MRLRKQCLIGGQDYGLVHEEITLHHNRPGRAILQVRAEVSLSGTVAVALGWHVDSALTSFFHGDVERSVPVDAKQQRLFCREITARLMLPHPLNIRHATLRQVLAAYAQRTGISFILPDRPYADTPVPAFYGTGSGFHGLDSVGAVFGIEDYCWQAQGDGRVFVGAWADSRWPSRSVSVPSALYAARYATGGQTLTAVPALRPGAVVDGRRVTSVRFSGHEMTLSFEEETAPHA